MTGREHETNSVILKEPKRVFRIYFQRVVVLQCELNYPRMQNQSLPFELVALRASEFDIRGKLGGVGGVRLNVGLRAYAPLQLPLFSTSFAKHLNMVIKGEGCSFLLCAQCFRHKPKKASSSSCWQSLWASRFLLLFLATPFYTVPRLAFWGRKHSTVRFVSKKFGD